MKANEHPPAPPLPQAEKVPADLLAVTDRWCGWRYVWDAKQAKWTKPPHSPLTGERIGIAVKPGGQDWSRHWTDLETACAGAKKFKLDGVGFIFVQGDGLRGTDFDDCRDPETGALRPEAAEWVNSFTEGYVEVSPSGRGVHAIDRGTVPGPGNKRPLPNSPVKVEIYDRARFFTFTGQALHAPGKIGSCAAVDLLHARLFGDRKSHSAETAAAEPAPESSTDDAIIGWLAKKQKWAKIFTQGEDASAFVREHHQGDESAADFAFCAACARYSHAPAQVERLWRRSILWRAKGERADYRTATITKALALTPLGPEARRLEVLAEIHADYVACLKALVAASSEKRLDALRGLARHMGRAYAGGVVKQGERKLKDVLAEMADRPYVGLPADGAREEAIESGWAEGLNTPFRVPGFKIYRRLDEWETRRCLAALATEGPSAVPEEAARRIEAAFVAQWENPPHPNWSFEDLVAEHGLTTAQALPIVLRVLDERARVQALARVQVTLGLDREPTEDEARETVRQYARLAEADQAYVVKKLAKRLGMGVRDLRKASQAVQADEPDGEEADEDEGAAGGDWVAELNKEYFVVQKLAGRCRVCSLEPDRNPLMNGRLKLHVQSYEDFRNYYLNQTVLGPTGLTDLGDAWLREPGRRDYRELIFAPGQDLGPDVYNLWQGFGVKPAKGDCSRYRGLIREVIANGSPALDQHVWSWMAYKVQHPAEHGHHALVLRGDKGLGKNFFAEKFGRLWGAHFLQLVHPEQVVGRFNFHLWNVCVLFANEAFFAGSHQHENMLKTYITESTLEIEKKFGDVITVPNLLAVILSSNSDWVAPASAKDERRYCVLDVSTAHHEDHEYFRAIEGQLDRGGYEALLYDLLETDLSGYNPRRAPHTAGLDDQVKYSMRPVEQAWYECLGLGELPGIERKQGKEVYRYLRASTFLAWAKHRRRDWERITAEDLGYLLSDRARASTLRQPMGFEKKRIVGATEFDSERIQAWSIPPLVECRRLWNQRRFVVPEWEEGTEEEWVIVSERAYGDQGSQARPKA
jgi:Family of unknown function (DUF5906)